MAFNSFHFLVFFPLVAALYFLVPYRFRTGLLLMASYYFYMSWKPEYGLLLVTATVVSYYAGIRMAGIEEKGKRKKYLVICCIALLGILFVFKYLNFFTETLQSVVGVFYADYSVPVFDILLPIGISFYTFQLVSYVVDVYRGDIQPERKLGAFALYASFFPQLVSGPIERASHLLPQLLGKYDFDYDRVTNGLKLVAWGLCKKVVIADRLAVFVQQVYANPTGYEGIPLIIATVFFAFQVYCDFSGYTDIARGAAQVLGYNLVDNFNRPYFATSIADFWKRWHISLSTWLTDYVYTPLTKSPLISMRWYYKFLLSIFLTFLLSGLWHGANWTFVVWGGMHGLYLIGSMVTRRTRQKAVQALGLDHVPGLHRALQIVFVFSLVCLSYVFFRANTLTDALYIVTHSFVGVADLAANVQNMIWVRQNIFLGQEGSVFAIAVAAVLVLMGVEFIQRYGDMRSLIGRRPLWFRWAAYYLMTVAIIVFGKLEAEGQEFIYFQF